MPPPYVTTFACVHAHVSDVSALVPPDQLVMATLPRSATRPIQNSCCWSIGSCLSDLSVSCEMASINVLSVSSICGNICLRVYGHDTDVFALILLVKMILSRCASTVPRPINKSCCWNSDSRLGVLSASYQKALLSVPSASSLCDNICLCVCPCV